ncbi:MAG: DUF423 domain-containing protein [Puniceicoccaceae bacterium]|nr:MAG: DUF423 domain-containing protein [Puniceicoccaceae bacterium]
MSSPLKPIRPHWAGLAACVFGLSGVVLGALGAHALAAHLEASGSAEIWHTAAFYHLVHAVAMLAWSVGAGKYSRSQLPGWLWGAGILAFSGSLYLLALGGPRFLGPVTPVGGVFLIAGWAVAGAVFLRTKSIPGRDA